MAIQLKDFMTILERVGRYGTPANLGVAGDQPTTDLLNSVNIRGTRIWGAGDWKWKRELLSFPVVVGTTQYQVKSKSGNLIDRILDIIPNDPTVSPPIAAPPLEELEIGDFYLKCPQSNVLPSTPEKYVNVGQDAAGFWNIIIWPPPASAFTMSGYAKALLPAYVNADVVANNPILYFPNGVVLDALMAGCLIDIGRIQGMTPEAALTAEAAWEAKIRHLLGEQIGVSSDNSPKTAPMADRIVNRMNRRRGSRGTWVS